MFSGDELIPRLHELYRLIDAAYQEAADRVGFSCRGCDGVACCTVDLILHTYAEMFYLRRGFKTLDNARQQEILERARAMTRAKKEDPYGDSYRNAVCALNFDGMCGLYEFRPMICRLAGIPHAISRPDGTFVESGGCVRYEREIRPAFPRLSIDRTGFYRKMAAIEIDVVREFGCRTVARTVAETLGLEDLEPVMGQEADD
jgi:hypothetical protein